LEHRRSKARFSRTNRKGFLKQIAQIERHQARLRRIRAYYRKAGKTSSEDVAISLEAHHVIELSQNFPEYIPVFLERHRGDPAIQVTHRFCFGYT
jgi:hypothetical protein